MPHRFQFFCWSAISSLLCYHQSQILSSRCACFKILICTFTPVKLSNMIIDHIWGQMSQCTTLSEDLYQSFTWHSNKECCFVRYSTIWPDRRLSTFQRSFPLHCFQRKVFVCIYGLWKYTLFCRIKTELHTQEMWTITILHSPSSIKWLFI
jgi:hypothetical protein